MIQSLRPLIILSAFLFTGFFSVACTTQQKFSHPDNLNFQPLVFHVPVVEKLTLNNGIVLYLKEDNELPLVQVTAMVGAGFLATPMEKVGFDELYAGVWRTGGTLLHSSNEIEESLALLAANLDCSMNPYFTQINLSIRADDLAEGLSIFAEILRKPAFAQNRLDLVRKQAQEKVRRQNDVPGAIARRLLSAALYPDHPLGQSPTMETLAAVTRENLVNFHKTYFAPNNLQLAISGDFDRHNLLTLLQQTLGDWQPSNIPEIPIPDLLPLGLGELQLVDRPVPQTTILIGGISLTKDDPDQYAARVLNYIFGGGSFNSRMMREIRSNRGLAYSAYSYLQVGRRLPGVFVAGTETRNEAVPEVLELIRQIMQDLSETPVSEDELQLAKESLINSFVFGFDDSHSVVTQQMLLDFFNYPEDYLTSFRDHIAEVSADNVQRVAQKLIRLDQQKIILVGGIEPYSEQLSNIGLQVIERPLEPLP